MTRSFWIDEILSYNIATQPIGDVLSKTSYPLSYVLIHYALQFGDTESILRLPSYIAGLLGVWFMYFLGRAVHSRQAGVVAALLLAVNSAHVYYSQDGRFYTLMPLGVIITLWGFLRAVQSVRPLKYWVAFSAGIMIGTLSHTFYLPFLAAFGVGSILTVLFRRGPHGRSKVKGILTLAAFTFIGLLPIAAVYFHHQVITPVRLIETGGEARRQYLLGVRQYVYYIEKLLLFQHPQVSVYAGILAGLGAIFLFLRRRWLALPLVIVAFVLPLPFFFIHVSHWFTEKYFVAVLPPILICLAAFFVEISRAIGYLAYRGNRSAPGPATRKWITSGILSVAILFISLELFTTQYYAKDLYTGHWRVSWKHYAENMAPHMNGDDIVIHYAPLHLNPYEQYRISFEPTPFSFDFYLRRVAAAGRADTYPTKHLLTASAEQLNTWLQQYPDKTFWLVHWNSEPMVPLSLAQQKLFEFRIGGFGSNLFVAGAPTTNLVRNGDMDPARVDEFRVSGLASIGSVDHNEQPDYYLHLSATDDKTSPVVRFNVAHPNASSATTTALEAVPHVLSFKMKYEDIDSNPHRPANLRVGIVSFDGPSGTGYSLVQQFYGHHDWQHYAFIIDPAIHPAVYDASRLEVEFAIIGYEGSVSVDKVQLEQGNEPSPFAEGYRPRHEVR